MKKAKSAEIPVAEPAENAPKLEYYFFDSAQMKQLFKISDSTLRRWRLDNLVKYRKVRGKYYYPYHLVMNFMKVREELQLY